MKKYLLWREKEVSGPYTLQELRALEPGAADRIWQEGESTDWQEPHEIQELTETEVDAGLGHLVAAGTGPELKLAGESKLQHKGKGRFSSIIRGIWTDKNGRLKRVFGLAAVALGMTLSVLCIKKFVESVVDQTFEAGFISHRAVPVPSDKVADKTYQNALVITIASKGKKVHPKPESPEEIRRQIELKSLPDSTNDGRLNGMNLVVTNNSAHYVNQVEVVVNHHNRGGELMMREIYPVKAMHPFSIQTLTIPSRGMGEKMTFKVYSVIARQYHGQLKEI